MSHGTFRFVIVQFAFPCIGSYASCRSMNFLVVFRKHLVWSRQTGNRMDWCHGCVALYGCASCSKYLTHPKLRSMITGLRNVPIRQETRLLTQRPEPLPVAPLPPPRPSQQLPLIPVRPSRLTHQLPPIPPRPTHQLPPLPVRPPRPAQQLPPIPVRRPVQTQQLPSVPRPPRPVDNPRGLQSVAPRPPVLPVDNLRASQNRLSIPATPMSYPDKGKGKQDIELCELQVAEQLLNLRYLPMHPSNIASSSR